MRPHRSLSFAAPHPHRPRLARPIAVALALAALSLALAPGSARGDSARRPVSDAPAFAQETDAWVTDALERLEIVPALAIAVVVDDEVVLARAWGLADVEAGTPADGRTQFYIASATKPFTGLLAAMLDAEGKVDLDSPLADHLNGAAMDPALKPAQVKLRDLLTHTSGIENSAIGFRVAFSGQHDPDLLWGLLDDSVPTEDAPLGTFKYTNVGYNIYTMITDRETGKVWQDQLRDRIFTPLGMARTTAYVSLGKEKGWPSAAPYFGLGRDGLERVPLQKTDETMQSAGGLMTTARDLARWMRFQLADGKLDGKQVVDAELVRSTHRPLATTEEPSGSPFGQEAYGLGWSHGTWRDHDVLSHGGGFSGFRSLISFLPGENVGVSVMVNEGSLGAMVLEEAVTRAYDWWLGTAEATPREAVDEMVQRRDMFAERMKGEFEKRDAREWMLARPRTAYAGRYHNDLYGTVVIAERDGDLDISQGNLHCVATAYPKEETARVELVPGSGRVVVFEPAEGDVEKIVLDGDEYVRVN